jgi:hypothetical protein
LRRDSEEEKSSRSDHSDVIRAGLKKKPAWILTVIGVQIDPSCPEIRPPGHPLQLVNEQFPYLPYGFLQIG